MRRGSEGGAGGAGGAGGEAIVFVLAGAVVNDDEEERSEGKRTGERGSSPVYLNKAYVD